MDPDRDATLHWTIVAGTVGAGWTMTAFIRDRLSQSVQRTEAIMNRLPEGDKLIIENPGIQKYISQTAMRDDQYFRSDAVLHDPLFYQVETFALTTFQRRIT